MFNFKETKSQKEFLKLTEETDELVNIFKTNQSLTVQTKRLIKRINGFVHQSFRKVKIETKPDLKLEKLYNRRNYLRTREDDISMEELEKLEDTLAEKYSE